MIQADITTTTNTISALAQCIAAVKPYCTAVEAIPLGQQPIVIDGQQDGMWDPLSADPATESALQTAQQNCLGFSGTTLGLLGFMPIVLKNVCGTAGSSGILNDLSVISSVTAAVGSGAPTAAQIQQVSGALTDIATQIATLQQGFTVIQGGTAAFESSMATDVQSMTDGSQSIASAITQVSTNFANAAAAYSGIGGEMITAILQTITDDMLTSLQNAQTAINAAVGLEGTVSPALTTLTGLFDGMFNDYTNIAKAAAAANAATFGSIIQQIDISLLQTYWQDLITYTTTNGFGVPPSQ